MGNKNKTKTKTKTKNQPFVSICTPTFNRRPFIKSMIKCFDHQIYPKDKMEWIIIDDGTDKIEDLVCDIPQVKYFKYEDKMVLGKKRNLMHEKSIGDILIYMDDDDYYPPERVSHAVNMLLTHPKALCAGSSEIYIYFKHINQMYQFGPYGPNHATAGTFAFKKELLNNNRYDDSAALAEEKVFLNDYTVPFVQLEPKKTILVFSHEHNTFDKKTLLENGENKFMKQSDREVNDFIKETDLKEFYMHEVEDALKDYAPGKPDMKPDVIKQIEEIKKEREQTMQKMMQQQQQQKQKQQEQDPTATFMIETNGEKKQLTYQEIVNLINEQKSVIEQFQKTQTGQIMADVDGDHRALSNEEIVNILREQKSSIDDLIRKVNDKDKIILELQK